MGIWSCWGWRPHEELRQPCGRYRGALRTPVFLVRGRKPPHSSCQCLRRLRGSQARDGLLWRLFRAIWDTRRLVPSSYPIANLDDGEGLAVSSFFLKMRCVNTCAVFSTSYRGLG